MLKDRVTYSWFTDCRDGLRLNCYAKGYVEVMPKWKAKVAHSKTYLRLFIVSSQSPNALKYNPEVCKRYQEEEKKLAKDQEKSLKSE